MINNAAARGGHVLGDGMATLLSIQAGGVAPLGPRRVPSGFVKHPVAGAVAIGFDGLAGDEQADLAVHGDAAKAVYAYAAESYALWLASHPHHAGVLRPGGMGENLTFTGLSEQAVCIGDTLRVGSAVLQVTQPREPCFKLGLRYGDPLMPRAMIGNGLSGWYCRVLAPGSAAAGDQVSVVERPNPGWPVSRMNAFIGTKRPPRALIVELAALPGLAETWTRRLEKRLATG